MAWPLLNEFIHGDCMDYMKDMPDNAFELAIVDPPAEQMFLMSLDRR